jgi:hypothetical protein
MADDPSAKTDKNEKQDGEELAKDGVGPGGGSVGLTGIVLLAAYLTLLFFFFSYVLLKIWPHCTQQQAETGAGQTPCNGPVWITFFWGTSYWLWDEIRLLLIVMVAGALGSILHSIRSLFWYVGNRQLRRSWALMYVLLPYSGTILSVTFYFIIRGGFFPQASAEQSNPISFAALAALAGLFSAQAVLKLKLVFETMLTTPPPGKNNVPQQGGPEPPGGVPTVVEIIPKEGPAAGGTPVEIKGTNFADGATVAFGGAPASGVSFVSADLIKAVTPEHQAGAVDVVVTNKDGKSGTLPGSYTYL